MSIITLLSLYFCIYSIALIFAYVRARQGNAPKARNVAAAMSIGAAGSLLIYLSALLEPLGTVPLVLVAIIALFPVFVFGLGCLLGIGIATWRPHPTAQLTLGALAIGLPLLAIFAVRADAELSVAVRPDTELSDLQRQTVFGRLGRYPVALPTSPQLETSYTCFAGRSADIGQCHADFSTSDDVHSVPGGVPIFHEITIAPKASDCSAPCLSFARLSQWCRTRNDVTFTEWCHRAPSEKITFSYDENRAMGGDLALGWRTRAGAFGAADVDCLHSTSDLLCKARYDIARNLQVTIWMDHADDAALEARLSAAQAYVARLWSEMQPG